MNIPPTFNPDLGVSTSRENPHRRYYCGCCEPNFREPLIGLTRVVCTWCTDHCGLACTRASNNNIPRLWTDTLNGSRFISYSGEWKE